MKTLAICVLTVFLAAVALSAPMKGHDSGRPHCRPTPEAQEQIHEVMVKTFGDEKATQIRADFDNCAKENKGNPKGHKKCLEDHFTVDQVAEMADAIEEAGITWECERKKGLPHCRPTKEVQEQIHEVMVKTFGEEKATQIRADFDNCAKENKGHPKAHAQCLRDHFTKDQVAEMGNAIEEAGITWECEKKGRPDCRPTPEAQEQIHEVMVETFGDEEATQIRADFDFCAENNKGNAAGHLQCLRDHFTKEEVAKMADAIEEAGITWKCEGAKKEKREEQEADWNFLSALKEAMPALKAAKKRKNIYDIDKILLSVLKEAMGEK